MISQPDVVDSAPGELSETRRSALRLTTQMSGASVLGGVIAFPIRVVIASTLGPTGVGLVRIAELIQKYANYLDGGVRYSLSRQVPILLGAGEADESRVISRVAFTWTLLIAVLGFLTNRPEFLDLALIYVFLNFIATVAILKFVQYKDFGRGGVSEGH